MFNSYLLLFCRFAGFFLLSPLFSERGIPKTVRWGAACACSLLLAPPLLVLRSFSIEDPSLFFLRALQEILVGYLMGFLFSLLFEAAAFAGQLVGTAMGFSATELLDPLYSSSHPLLARLFALTAFALFFTLDLHHSLLRILFGSFEAFPLLHYPLSQETASTLLQGGSLLFQQALAFAAFPLSFSLSIIALLAVLSRFLPIFWIGFPLQLLVGLFVLAAGISFFPSLLERGFASFWTLLQNFIVHL